MATNQHLASQVIKRFAIDSAGRLGSLYDAYRDCILGQLDVKSLAKSNQSLKSASCQIIKSGINEKVNILRLVGIVDELQLSILFNLTPKSGLASLIDCSHPTQELTRILSFHYVNDEERLPDHIDETQQSFQSLTPQMSATHIVTGVSWGFYAVVILHLPSEEETIRKVDDTLEKIENAFENNQDNLTLDADEEDLLGTLTTIEIHSNVPELTRMTTLCDICRHIDRLKSSTVNYPVTYTLRSITYLCPEYTGEGATFVSLPPALIEVIQTHILQTSAKLRKLEVALNDHLPKSLGEHLKRQLYDAHQQWSAIKQKYTDEIDRLSKLLFEYRSGQLGMEQVKEALRDSNHTTLVTSIQDLTETLKSLEEKGRMIIDLPPFQYCNVAERGIDENDSNETMERKLMMDGQCDRVLCTNDVLNKTNPVQLKQLRCQLVQEHEENSSLHLVYADFSYASFPLSDIMVLPSNKMDDVQAQPTQQDTPSPIIVPLPSTSPDIINILLLGETGVGKSTFINAFVNYLTFDSLQTAESNKPVILIPVSFILTAGEKFEEYTIELDHMYKSNDEHFNAFGQSVTQRCRSYILHLKNSHGKQIRLIDTSGFGDTRGVKQDERNMQHILEYVNSLTHFNAICFLFKSNTRQVNSSFRSCITQLLDHIGPRAGENILFCFTNARATFFTPGDTAPLLKMMLTSLSIDTIPFKKDNTFCFDSESFRYLVALQKHVPFDHLNKSEYERSWAMSIKESNRLMDFICKDLPAYRMQHEQQSIKSVQFEVMHMIRPMLEATRNILRNIHLCILDSPNNSIELRPKTLYRLATQCLFCKPFPLQVGHFWVPQDIGHEIQGKCLTCECTFDQHSPTEYMLEYECSTNTYSFDELNNMFHPLSDASVEFAYFLMYVTHSTKEDPFSTGYIRMIEEEKDIFAKVQPNEPNLYLVQQLEDILRAYQERMNQIRDHPWDNNLSVITGRIKTISEYPMVSEQLSAIKQGQEMITNHHEYTC